MGIQYVTISGKKKSGKDTVGTFLQEKLSNNYTKTVYVYHFADKLKEFCIDYLDLPRELVYGTDEQKNTLSHLRWIQMPFYERMRQKYALGRTEHGVCTYLQALAEFDLLHMENDGLMTIREVLQYIGTEEFRESYGGDYWIKQLDKKIKKDSPDISIICDCRFPEEVLWGKENGVVIKLTRGLVGDAHSSETALDAEHFDQSNFSHIIDNRNQTVEETCKEALTVIKKLLGI